MSKVSRAAIIADGDEYFRLAMHSILRDQLGFSKVVQATSLDEAVKHLSEEPNISMAVLERTIPGLKSPACLTALRQRFPALRLAIISTSDKRQDILAALEAGVHGFVLKTISPADLTAALKLIMDEIIYIPSSVTAIPSPSDEQEALNETSAGKHQVIRLPTRQREVLGLLMHGKSNKEIARALKLSEGTIKIHIAALFRAFGARSRAAVAAAGSQLLLN
ncbi:response regulator transcription factor [Microvirga sp. VF16]|uniref:response regulator transcription factor n=1 Tax=Microvirga sp. VF16 TaxID=2807101 RepID=UPI00193DAAA8|nr:response regulator transcription factor [Microvirga sp. VF16]QRM27655.1 response regulator transcription factor [Microvirga sp. VF16]